VRVGAGTVLGGDERDVDGVWSAANCVPHADGRTHRYADAYESRSTDVDANGDAYAGTLAYSKLHANRQGTLLH
jgi:hypothetical protein